MSRRDKKGGAQMEEKVIKETNLPLELLSRGKVRDTYVLPYGKKLLMVATDRISAFDVVVGAIPGKGKILTKMSEFWFNFFSDINSHFLPHQWGILANCLTRQDIEGNDLYGRSMTVMKANAVIPIECVIRGYLAGSGWQEYQQTGKICGNFLPSGLCEGDKLPKPIFTPATKTEAGAHDESITVEKMGEILNGWLAEKFGTLGVGRGFSLTGQLKEKSIGIYQRASDYAFRRGIIIADTKFEFGIIDGEIVLIDEVLTPDSSRFWPANDWQPGRPQESFDKQYLRDWLIKEAKWDKKSPPPELPPQVVQKTREKYEEALRRLIPEFPEC